MRLHESPAGASGPPVPDRQSRGVRMVEGLARVVRVEGRAAWLVPEQTTGCGSCALASACTGGLPPESPRRLLTRRFALEDMAGLAVGDRVVVGVAEGALLLGALTAYALPLLVGLLAASIAEAVLGSDLVSMAAMLAGIGTGMTVARMAARRLGARGRLSPRFLRRAGPAQACELD